MQSFAVSTLYPSEVSNETIAATSFRPTSEVAFSSLSTAIFVISQESEITVSSELELTTTIHSSVLSISPIQTELILSTGQPPLESIIKASTSLNITSTLATQAKFGLSTEQPGPEPTTEETSLPPFPNSTVSSPNVVLPKLASSSKLGNLSSVLPRKSGSINLPTLLLTQLESTNSLTKLVSTAPAHQPQVVTTTSSPFTLTLLETENEVASVSAISTIHIEHGPASSMVIPLETPTEGPQTSLASSPSIVLTSTAILLLSETTPGPEAHVSISERLSTISAAIESKLSTIETLSTSESSSTSQHVAQSSAFPQFLTSARETIASTILPTSSLAEKSALSKVESISVLTSAPQKIFHTRTLSPSSTQYGNLSITFGVVRASSSLILKVASPQTENPPPLASSTAVSQVETQATAEISPLASPELSSAPARISPPAVAPVVLSSASAIPVSSATVQHTSAHPTSTESLTIIRALAATTLTAQQSAAAQPGTQSVHVITHILVSSTSEAAHTESFSSKPLLLSSRIFISQHVPEALSSTISASSGLFEVAHICTSITTTSSALYSQASAAPALQVSSLAVTQPHSTVATTTTAQGVFSTVSRWYNATRNLHLSTTSEADLIPMSTVTEPASIEGVSTAALFNHSHPLEVVYSTTVILSSGSSTAFLPGLASHLTQSPLFSLGAEINPTSAGLPGQLTTSTIFTTVTYTITACPNAITNCPIGSKKTQVISLTTTVYPVTQAPLPSPWTTSTVYTAVTYTVTSCPVQITNCPLGKTTTESIPVYTTVCPASVPPSPQPAQSQPPVQPPLDSPPTQPLAQSQEDLHVSLLLESQSSQTEHITAPTQSSEPIKIIGILVTIIVDIIVEITINDGLTTTTYITATFYSDTSALWNTATLGQPCYPCQMSSANYSCPSSDVTITRTLCRSSPGIAPSPYIPPVIHTCASCLTITLKSGFQPPIYTNIEGKPWFSSSTVRNHTSIQSSFNSSSSLHISNSSSFVYNTTSSMTLSLSSRIRSTSSQIEVSDVTAPQTSEEYTAIPQQAGSLYPILDQLARETSLPQNSIPDHEKVADHEQPNLLDDTNPDSTSSELPPPIHPFPVINDFKTKSGGVIVLGTSILLILSMLFGILFVL
jgi:hypothetical protein